ncbi:WD40 repeat domain-containing protein [Streptomyces sp. TLI_053]|uniref:WD40 repeat domain-containing protein n=1 Tax=Streptomyces sp. TLI_053 TaxID=1855352 RepID=UPI000B816429|nr:WD40 repeat domain-containing protein [Streptomyces sp. TLI_053]
MHIVGHGELADGSSEKLYILDNDGNRLSRPVGSWIDLIEDHPQRHRPMTLFVLDVCYSGQAAVTAWHSRMDVDKRKSWVLAASRPDRQAFGYRLSQALVQVLTKYHQALEIRFDSSLRYIPAAAVWRDVERAVNELAEESGGLPQSILTSLVPGHADLSHLPFFPNPSYASHRTGPAPDLPPEIARLADWAADPLHFMRRAGGGEPVARDWSEGYFSGRTEQLDTLATWLDDDTAAPGLRVITGRPGAGKSALLGLLLCAAHPALRRHTRPLWATLHDHVPGENNRIAAVHARRLGLDHITASLARQLRHITDPDAPAPANEEAPGPAMNPAQRLLDLLPPGQRPVTVVIDALDEAIRPQDITTALLLPLARHAQTAGARLRLLVATRADTRFDQLLDLAQDSGACTDLSTLAPYEVRRDVSAYAKRLLTADGPYIRGNLRPVRDALADAIADTLTAHPPTGQSGHDSEDLQWGEFLTTGLYVHHLLATPPATTPEEATRLGRAVPRSLPDLLELDLQRHTDQPHLRPVLTALAFAQGRGMPESVLVHAAAAFTAPDTPPSSLPELYTLLDGEARFYLRRDIDTDGTTLYRLFHQGLADWLRGPAGEPSHKDSATTTDPLPGRAERLFEQLLQGVPRDRNGGLHWQHAHGYLIRHAAQHAIDAGRLDELLFDAGYLQHADPHTLADALSYTQSEQGRLNASVYLASWGVHHALPPVARRQILALDAARFRNTPLQSELPGDADWTVRWATANQVSPSLVRILPGHTHGVNAVAVTHVNGRPHAITGSNDNSVRLWDLTTGTQTHHLTGHTSGVNAVAVTRINGHPHAITGSNDNSVRLWDLTTGTQTHHLTGHTSGVNAVAVTRINGHPHAITGSNDNSVRLWDLTTGTQTHHLTGHTDWVRSVAVMRINGHPHAITGSDDNSVRLWDLTTGTQTHHLTGHTSGVNAVAVTRINGHPHAITGSNDNSVRLWDLTTGTEIRTLTGHSLWVNAVAVTRINGHPHAITGSNDNSVRVWDLTTGTQTHHLTGHTFGVNAVAVTRINGHPHAITGSYDPSMRVWDLATGTEIRTPTGHSLWVNAVAVARINGHPHAITGSDDNSVRVWDLTTGTQTHHLTGHTSGVNAVAVTRINGRPHAITGSDDNSVRVWDLTTGTQTHHLTGHTSGVNAVVVTRINGRPHAITGSDDNSVRAWDLTTGTQTHHLTGHTVWVRSVAVTHINGRPHAITGDDNNSVRLWDLTTGTEIRTLTGHTSGGDVVAATRINGRPHAITGSYDRSVRLWDLTTGTHIRELTGHTGQVRSVAVAHINGHPHAITGSDDNSVRLWDLTTGTCLTSFHLPDVAWALAFSGDGTVVVGFGHEVAVLCLNPLIRRLR